MSWADECDEEEIKILRKKRETEEVLVLSGVQSAGAVNVDLLQSVRSPLPQRPVFSAEGVQVVFSRAGPPSSVVQLDFGADLKQAPPGWLIEDERVRFCFQSDCSRFSQIRVASAPKSDLFPPAPGLEFGDGELVDAFAIFFTQPLGSNFFPLRFKRNRLLPLWWKGFPARVTST